MFAKYLAHPLGCGVIMSSDGATCFDRLLRTVKQMLNCMWISCVLLPTSEFRYRTRSGPRLAGLRMLLILVAFFISFGTNICIKPNFAGKDLHQMVSAHFSKVSIKSAYVSLIFSERCFHAK